ncbi:hypothetical protein V6N13_035794 [Hibiscus sabdariffa]
MTQPQPPPSSQMSGLKKGPWTPEEDQKLSSYIRQHGDGNWRALPEKAGLQRCGKSCRLRWSAIAAHLPKRTDNEIKNYWNTRLKRRLSELGIDPATHKPKADALGSSTSNLRHMAQWERARLEAEAKLVRESRRQLGSSCSAAPPPPVKNRNAGVAHVTKPPCLDVLKAWQRVVTGLFIFNTTDNSLQSPTSTSSFVENTLPVPCVGFNNNDGFVGNSNVSQCVDSTLMGSNGMLGCSSENAWWAENAMEWEGYPAETLMVCNAVNHNQQGPAVEATGFEEDNNYWNSILDLANVSPSANY